MSRVKRPFLWIFALLIVYCAACIVTLAAADGRLTVYRDIPDGCVGTPDFQLNGSCIEFSGLEARGDGKVKIDVRGIRPGEADMEISWSERRDMPVFVLCRTGFLHATVDMETLNFSGCRLLVFHTAGALVLLVLIVLSHFFWRLKNDFYSYRTAFTGGMAVYGAVIALLFLLSCRDFLSVRGGGTVYGMLNYFSGAGTLFMGVSAPFLLLLCAGLFISNLSLIRHEGLRPANLLAAGAAVAVIGGFILTMLVDNSFSAGSFEEYRRHACLNSAVTTVFVFMEAVLLGAMVCGLIAARREPDYDRDFVIIHGCQIAPDGTPLPLLRGRIDRALAFAEKQRQKTGKPLIFIPSGGQGSNECISEGRSIADYLRAKGVPEYRLLIEEQSKNTLENMQFSKALIDRRVSPAKVAFSTTNYHVFRSGILAKTAGLEAQGMGSPTKWYFWPNAFIREFIGLVVTEKKALLILLAEMIVFFTALTYFSTI